MNDYETIRNLVISGKAERIRNLLLGKPQIDLYKLILKREKQEITSRELANEKSLTIQNALSKLKRLYDSGYVDKFAIGSRSSGGSEFVFFINREIEQ